jgi:IS30 family transposase
MMKRSTISERDKGDIITLFHQKCSIREICTSLNIYRKQVEGFLLSEGLIDTSACKYYH